MPIETGDAEGSDEKTAPVLDDVISAPVLLVACDYDGTISPHVDDPVRALPVRESIVALRSLASIPDTHVAVISGRSLRDLAALSRLPPEVHLVGSHGSEFEPGFANALPEQIRRSRAEVLRQLEEIGARAQGTIVERKPASVAFHYRLVEPALAAALVAEVLSGPARLPGVTAKRGKMVIELSLVETDKGAALTRIRQLVGADAVIFIGDDLTDEDAFSTLTGPDLGIKVGPGPTCATSRLADTDAVARFLADLFDRRHAWLEGDSAPPIERHTLLSDQRTVALVTPDARISWFCHPRADSPAVFAELLGGPTAGSFVIRPDPVRAPLAQRYLADSLVVETRWPGLRVTDYLDVAHGRAYEPAGRTDLVRVIEGDTRVLIEFSPRVDFGRVPTRLEVQDDGLRVLGAGDSVQLVAPGVSWTVLEDGPHQRAVALVELRAGEPLVCEMRVGVEGAVPWHADEPERRRATMEYWSGWASTLRLPLVAPRMVLRSALTLKALCYQPTGAILAAATTSLPEEIRGSRNWDYRYCWVRDAAVAAHSLLRVGSTREALAYLDWLIDRVAHVPSAERLRPLYPLAGDEFLSEAVIPTLNGYRGSRPVRIGNLAEHQLQLDMFGPVVDLVHRLGGAGVYLTERHWDLTRAIVDAVCSRWREPDHGIWEERRAPRQFVVSKVMCWTAVDRGIAIASSTGRPPPEEWIEARTQIKEEVLREGWNPEIGSFSASYGDSDVDAGILQVRSPGMLPPDDPRVIATVLRVERVLREGEVVFRYRHGRRCPGGEGGFLLCTAWLIEAFVAIGRLEDARELFDRYVDLAGPTGLLSEEFDPVREIALGNFPQAYSHAGLINAAVALSGARTMLA